MTRRMGKSLRSSICLGAAIGTPMTDRVAGRQSIALAVQAAAPGDVPEMIALTLQASFR